MLLLVIVLFSLSAHSVFLAVVSMAVRRRPKEIVEPSKCEECAFILLLVPAYNEGEFLRPTLRSLCGLDYPQSRFQVAVIADNCTDNTALVAEEEGCEAWVRVEPQRRGKGHALAWALNRDEIRAFDAIVVVDADTEVSSNLLRVFNRELRLGCLAIQSASDFTFPPTTPPWISMPARAANRAYENYVAWPRSIFDLYQGLHGTGFCLSCKILGIVPWRARSICEDLEYGIALSRHGVAVRFVTDTVATSVMTGKVQHASGQRERWSGGTYALILRLLPQLVIQGIRRKDWRSFEACAYLIMRSRVPVTMLTVGTALGLLFVGRSSGITCWSVFGLAVVLQCTYVSTLLSSARPATSVGLNLWWLCKYATWTCLNHWHALLNLRNAVWNRTERG